jgi:hypothetical protein
VPRLEAAAAEFAILASANKTFILKGARSAQNRRPFDGAAMFDTMATAWEKGHRLLRELWL